MNEAAWRAVEQMVREYVEGPCAEVNEALKGTHWELDMNGNRRPATDGVVGTVLADLFAKGFVVTRR